MLAAGGFFGGRSNTERADLTWSEVLSLQRPRRSATWGLGWGLRRADGFVPDLRRTSSKAILARRSCGWAGSSSCRFLLLFTRSYWRARLALSGPAAAPLALPPMQGRTTSAEASAEFVGAFALTFIGVGAIVARSRARRRGALLMAS